MNILKKIFIKLYPTQNIVTQTASKIRPCYLQNNQKVIDNWVDRLEPYVKELPSLTSKTPDYLHYHNTRLNTAQFYKDLEAERIHIFNKELTEKFENNSLMGLTTQDEALSIE